MIPTPAEMSRTNSWFQSLLGAIPGRARLMSLVYSLTDQALTVGGGFLANVAVARAQTKEEYGLFALSYSVYALLLALYQAVILEPFTIYGSGRYRERFSEYLRLMVRSNAVMGLLLTASLLLICFLLSRVAPQLVSPAFWGLALTAAVLLSSHLLRRGFYLQRQPVFAAKTSLVFFTTVACGLWLGTKSGWLNSLTVFMILAAGWITAGGIFGRKLSFGKPERSFLQIEPHYWREHWNYSKWVLASAIIIQFTTQVYYWLLAGFLSAKEAGELRAIHVLVAPMDQVYNGPEPSQVHGFFTGRISATDHHQRLIAKHGQSPVAGCAIGNAFVFELKLAFEFEMAVPCPAGDNHRFRLDTLSIDYEAKRLL